MKEFIHYLPHVNASLNTVATILLVVGFILIKRHRETAHKWTMLTCFGVSVLFLVCYITYHIAIEGRKKFPSEPHAIIRYTYYFILVTHSFLAALVPFLASATIFFGLRNWRPAHVKLARWTFPIWLYVSVTGVIVYLFLYQLFPPTTP